MSLEAAIKQESKQFEAHYLWLKKYMPPAFFEEIAEELLTLIARELIDFELRQNFAVIFLKRMAIVLCPESPDADLRILENFRFYGIKNYLAFVSKEALTGYTKPLRIGLIYFTEAVETAPKPFSEEARKELKKRTHFSDEEFDKLVKGINTRFLNSLPMDLLEKALHMFERAKTRDTCQYEVFQEKDSLQIVLAWKGAPKYDFLYHIAHIIFRHKLVMTRVNATYIDPYETNSILIMALGLKGHADTADFLKELVTAKYFPYFDAIGSTFVDTGILSGNYANFLRTLLDFVFQLLVSIDRNLYSYQNCEEALLRHPELTKLLILAFEAKFSCQLKNEEKYKKIQEEFYTLVQSLDTGNDVNDLRRKTVLKQGMNFVKYTLKTNFYQNNKTAFAFRLDPTFLSSNPDRFTELPYGVFFIANKQFIAFHIRFQDLARGGVRTIFTDHPEKAEAERANVLVECYHLALTQDKKNKDIPEGGAKAVIFVSPFEKHKHELPILMGEMRTSGMSEQEIRERLKEYLQNERLAYLYSAQRAFIRNLLTLVNCTEEGKLLAKNIVDYYKKPEYLYLGPDENMHDAMIEWISQYSIEQNYKPKSAFISGKPDVGINHKQYGVTSLGVNIYMIETLKYLGIDPASEPFSIKIAGGPDGDVAGNQIKNLALQFPHTAKIVAITDVSGTIRDMKGLNLTALLHLVQEGKPIKYYPAEKLSEGAFLLDLTEKKEVSEYVHLTLLKRKSKEKIVEEWISGNEMNALFRTNVHGAKADIFIPAGGRPRTLHQGNYKEFLDETDIPTSKAIIEGANLYLTEEARTLLGNLGVLIIKDSSANKTGVICSSFEVLSGLTLGDAEFLKQKEKLIPEVLSILAQKAGEEARLLLKTLHETKQPLPQISDGISFKINLFFDQLFTHLQTTSLSESLLHVFFDYCPPLLRHYKQNLLTQIPETHKKAIIACSLASHLVYTRGLSWSPTLVDILPVLLGPSSSI